MSLTQTKGGDVPEVKKSPTNNGNPNKRANPAARRGRPPKGADVPKLDKRLQIKLSEAGRQQLDELAIRVGANGVAEVIRDAIRVYDITTEQVMVRGNQLLVRIGDTGDLKKLVIWGPRLDRR